MAILALVLCSLVCGVSVAAPLQPADVPAPLQPWID
jgi:hypothetical protein